MKKIYTKPVVEVIRFDKHEDIITCSGGGIVEPPHIPGGPINPPKPPQPPKPPHPHRP